MKFKIAKLIFKLVWSISIVVLCIIQLVYPDEVNFQIILVCLLIVSFLESDLESDYVWLYKKIKKRFFDKQSNQ
jgi:hypothetical protein